MVKPGFIRHPWSNQRGDSICVTSVIQRIENETMCEFNPDKISGKEYNQSYQETLSEIRNNVY